MKASEAIAILQSLDPNYEVTLILGEAPSKRLPQIPKWNGTPMYPPQREYWMKTDTMPPWTITCGNPDQYLH